MKLGVIFILFLLSISNAKFQIVCDEVAGVQTLSLCYTPGCNDVYEHRSKRHDFDTLEQALSYANGDKCKSPPRLYEVVQLPLSQVVTDSYQEEMEMEETIQVPRDIFVWKIKE